MKNDELFYITALAVHLGLGLVLFFIPFLGTVYGIAVFLLGIGYVVNTQNRNNEALLMAAYCVGMDVYLKMIGADLLNEYGKYTVMIFMALGIFYQGFSKSSFLYVFFILLLLPGVFLGTQTLSLDANIRKAIAFNITGPACLAVCAIYCLNRVISLQRLLDVFAMLLFPMVAMLVNLFLFAPDVQQVITSTESNFATSGGFGPNQVSTVLGLAMFVAFGRLFLASPTKKLQLIHAFLVLIFAYRCLITFSRGGMFTGVFMILLLIFLLYGIVNVQAKGRLILLSIACVVGGFLIWGISLARTDGLIEKRYAGQDARGREKASQLSGREVLIETELNMFLNNPLWGVGVGKNKEIRIEETGIQAASHNELTRMLAEHGSLGLLGLVILFFTPLVLYLSDRTQLFALIFMVFWLLTINHAAMRIAAPAFVYALALLKVQFASPKSKSTNPEMSPS